jgi:hypothetical protein
LVTLFHQTSEKVAWQAFLPSQLKTFSFRVFDSGTDEIHEIKPGLGMKTDDPAFLNVALYNDPSSGSAIDVGAQLAPWDATAGLGNQIALKPSGGGGLSAQQDQALQEVHESTFVDHVLDTLTLDPMSPPGGGAGPFSRTLLTPTAGILVRMTAVDPQLLPNTPDGDYWLPSLAVIRLFRGSDLWKRIPVHTSSKLYYWLDENVVVGATEAVFSGWLLNMSVQVTIREGCQAEVFVLHYP